MRRSCLHRLSLFGLLLAVVGEAAPAVLTAQEAPGEIPSRPTAAVKGEAKKNPGLRIVDPVVCKSIEGYEEYEPLPEAAQTSDEKLLVYYRPRGYKIVRRGEEYVAHLAQDGQVRPLGRKKVLLRKANLLDYEAKSGAPPDEIYLRNTFSLKGLPPGEYEYDITLKDLNAEGVIAKESVKFRIVAAKLPMADPEAKPDACIETPERESRPPLREPG